MFKKIVVAGFLAGLGLAPVARAQGVVQPPGSSTQLLELRLREAQQRNLLLRQQLDSIREAMQARNQVVPPVGSAPIATPGPGELREQYRQRIVDEFLGVQLPPGAAPIKAFVPPRSTSEPPTSFAVPVPTQRKEVGALEVLPIAPDGTSVPGTAAGFVPPPRVVETPPLSLPGATPQ